MLDEMPIVPAPRRVSPVTRALRPLHRKIGVLQGEIAFLIARNLHAMRQPGDRVALAEVATRRLMLAEARTELGQIGSELPERLQSDTRLRDTLAAIERLDSALDILGGPPSA